MGTKGSQVRWLAVGLGNPGRRYRLTRHNVGFRVVVRLAREHGIRLRRRMGGAQFGEGEIKGELVVLACPLTFMNNSGDAVRVLVEWLDIPLERLIVVHDDLDLPCGRVKIKYGGGHGGHKGVESIINALGGGEFLRVKVGIGRPPSSEEGAGYVLSPFSRDEKKIAEAGIIRGAAAIEEIIFSGKERAMSFYNRGDLV